MVSRTLLNLAFIRRHTLSLLLHIVIRIKMYASEVQLAGQMVRANQCTGMQSCGTCKTAYQNGKHSCLRQFPSTESGRNTWRFGNTAEWNHWRGEFVLERPSSETQSISVAIERWSVEHRAFTVKTYFKNNDSVVSQTIFRRHFNIQRNECP